MSGESILLRGFWDALGLIFSGDERVLSAAFISVGVSSVSTVVSSIIGMPLGFFIAVRKFRGKQLLITLLNTLLALPTVVIGLFVYALIRRGSMFGPLDLLFSPAAMVVGQTILATPIVIAFTHAAIASLDRGAHETSFSLGATPHRVWLAMAWEARFPLMAAVAAAGGRVIGEVGVSMMLGGNIENHTRNLTTAIALETSKGEFAFAISLGIILVAIALGVNFLLRYLQGKGRETA